MTLVWLALILALLVWGAVFLIWDARIGFRRQARAAILAFERSGRAAEDALWAEHRLVEYRLAMTLSLVRASVETGEELLDALEHGLPPQLDVVA